MRTISYKLDDLKKAIIRIGYVGENQHTQVRLDCSDLFKEYPDAAVSAAIVSPAGQSYPKVVTVDGSTVVWDVTDSDLAAEGDGEIQLTFTEGGVVAKTAVARFNVYRSITADGPAPDPVDDWLQEASEALEDIEAAEVNQPIIGQDGYWYKWNQEAGEYQKTDTKAQGEDGQPGHTPEKGVDYWTAADKAEMESDVAGAIIDDTSTALDKTWSASKSNTLLSEIDEKASAIIDETTKTEIHNNLNGVQSIAFYKNDHAFSNARFINSKNHLPDANTTWTENGVTMVADGHFVTYNGTATARTVKFVLDKKLLDDPMPAGNYKFRIELQQKMSSYTGFVLALGYESDPNTRVEVVNKYIGNTNTVYEYEFTATEKVTKISYKVGTVPDETYNNYKLWFGVFDASAEIVDIGVPVLTNDPVIYDDPSIKNLVVLSTMQHKSIVNFIADTKKYVDTHIPDIVRFWNNNIYALPENFGAVGDGIADDTQALIDCIAYSASSGKPVRGFAKYKTTNKLLINGRNQDVFIKHIVYTGNDAAIQISDRFIRFSFDVIESSNVGIMFEKYGNQTCMHHKISGVRINSVGDCIRAKDETYYITIDVRIMETTNGNCINSDYTAEGKNSAEYVIRDCSFACATGWVAYKPFGYKFYGCTVEGNCENGYYNPINCSFFGCRHREFVDSTMKRIWDGESQRTNGPLFKFISSPNYKGAHGMKYLTADGVPWHCIDVSEIGGYDDITYIDSESVELWRTLGYNGQDVGITIRNDYSHLSEVIGTSCYFIGNNKVFAPNGKTEYVLSKAEYDMTLFEGQTDSDIQDAHDQGGWGTDFVTGYSHTDYYMNASFGAIGYNDLTITQKNGNTCTFYDKLGNVIFDGTSEGDGKWSMKCKIDKGSTGRLKNPPSYLPELWWCYDGTNEIWEIEKIE